MKTWKILPRPLIAILCLLAIFPAGSVTAFDGDVTPRWGMGTSTRENGGSAYSSLEVFYPVGELDQLLFVDGRLIFDHDDHLGLNWGLGFRQLEDSGVLWGVNLFMDQRSTDYASYQQLGTGWEAAFDDWELHQNIYVPVFRERKLIGNSGTPTVVSSSLGFTGNTITHTSTTLHPHAFEQNLTGTDFEIGRRVPIPVDDVAAKLFLGGYYFDNPDLTDAPGISTRMNISWRDDVEINSFLQHDRFFGTTVGVGFTWYPGRDNSPPGDSVARQVLSRPVARRRVNTIARGDLSYEETTTTTIADPSTGSPISITHVDPNATATSGFAWGTYENPYRALPTTQSTDIVYLHADSVFAQQSYTLNSGQRLIGEGAGVTNLIETQSLGTIALPAGNGGTDLPRIENTTGLAITLADHSSLENLAVRYQVTSGTDQRMIVGNNVTGVTISGLDFDYGGTNSDSPDAIVFENSEVSITDSSFYLDCDSNGLLMLVAGTSQLELRDSDLEIDGRSGALILDDDTNADITDSTFVIQGNYGIGIVTSSGTVNLTGVEIETPGDDSQALRANYGGTVNLTDSRIETTGTNSEGITVDHGTTLNLYSTDVRTEGNYSSSIRSAWGYVNVLSGSSLVTEGESAPVVNLFQATMEIDSSSLESFGDSSNGISIGANSTLNVNDSIITTHGSDSLVLGNSNAVRATLPFAQLDSVTMNVNGPGTNGIEWNLAGELRVLNSELNVNSGIGIDIQPVTRFHPSNPSRDIDLTLLNNQINSLNATSDFRFDTDPAGTLTIFQASDLTDLRARNHNAGGTQSGTVVYSP